MPVTFLQGAKFAFPRSYIAGIQPNLVNTWFVELTTNPITLRFNGTGGFWQRIQIHIAPEFWDWNSNCYTMDFVITRINTFTSAGAANEITTYTVGLSSGCSATRYYIRVAIPGFTRLAQVNLPPTPPSYWFPQKVCPNILT
jgi:hypothetical protein